MLKRKLDQTTFDGLSAEHKTLYKEKDGVYILDAEGGSDDDAGELRRAKQRETQKAKDEKKRADDLQAELDDLSGNDAKKRGDIDALERSWEEKLTKQQKEADDSLAKKDVFIRGTLVDTAATSLAAKVSGDKAHLILPHIKSRLVADMTGDTPITRVLDSMGQVSAMTVSDLEKEFIANESFSSIIVGSKASGSGASTDKQHTGPGGAASNAHDAKAFGELSTKEKVEHIKAKKAAQT